jgi:histidine triad (HIT) family protein
MDNESCIFCDIVKGKAESSIILQDNLCTVFMDIQPVNEGHILIVPNHHATYLEDLDADVGAHLFRIGQRMAKAIRKSNLKCEGINFFIADGEEAGQEVFHVHLHVIPRFNGDGFELKYGETNFIKRKRPELDHVAELIKDALI